MINYEKETIINFNDEEKDAIVYTCNRAMMVKMDRLCKKHPDIFRLDRQDEFSKTYSFPKKYASIRNPRIMSEEQKAKVRERFKSRINSDDFQANK